MTIVDLSASHRCLKVSKHADGSREVLLNVYSMDCSTQLPGRDLEELSLQSGCQQQKAAINAGSKLCIALQHLAALWLDCTLNAA